MDEAKPLEGGEDRAEEEVRLREAERLAAIEFALGEFVKLREENPAEFQRLRAWLFLRLEGANP